MLKIVISAETILPSIYTVGDEAYLSCIGSKATGLNETVTWTKSDGELPEGSRVEQGVLIIPAVHKNDEGSYTCEIRSVVEEEDEENEEDNFYPVLSRVDLQIDDFVPIISGDPIELPPLSDDELRNFDIEVTLNTTVPQGVIFSTERVNSGDLLADTKELIHHEANINNDGTVRYEFDLGNGKEEVATTNSIHPNEFNIVRIQNNKDQVTIQLNGEEATVRKHSYPLPGLITGVNKPVFIGGKIDPVNENDDFNGIISNVVLSGKNISLGEAKTPPSVQKYDTCLSSGYLCLNEGVCRNSNNHKGFICECGPKYHGEFCQWRSSRCHDENCNTGICLDNEESWQCVCPLNTTGLRCEETVPIPQPLGFTAETSFIAVKKPTNFQSIQLKFKPKLDKDEHILMYSASKYGPKAEQFTSLSLIENQIVLTVNRPGKGMERVRSEPLKSGEMVDVSVQQNGNTLVMKVNGKEVSTVESTGMRPGTEIFIGGLPPGLSSPTEVVEQSFQGCVYEISINSQDVDLNNLSSSGDISPCDEAIMFPVEVTTTTTTTEQPTTEPEVIEETTTTTTIVPETTTTTTEEPYNIYSIPKDDELEIIIPETTTTPLPVVLPTDDEDEDEYEYSTETTTTTTTENPEITTELPNSEDDDDYEREEEVEERIEDEEGNDDEYEEQEKPSVIHDECGENGCPLPTEDLSHVCNETACGMNGVCVPQNSTHFECLCKLYYDGPTCNTFKPIEHAAKFDGNAFIELSSDEFPHLTSEKDEIISFKFKTQESNGVLLWQGQRPTVTQMEDYISVGIVNGHLHYSYELGGGAAHLISEERVNDGKQHYARFERRGRRGLMKIDNYEEIHGMSTGILAMLNVDGNIFVGGIPDIKHSTGGLFSRNFVGCIADVELNGVRLDLMATAIDGKNVKPCDEWMSRKRWLYRRRIR